MSIESNYDTQFVASLALREKQIQQNYRPVIAVHKWFARRPGTLFRALLLSEFVDAPIADAFYSAHDLAGVTVADPFMGGGTPLVEANRAGCNIVGFDINPMSHWIVREEIERLDSDAYRETSGALVSKLRQEVGDAYATRCLSCGDDAEVKYFLWVKQVGCLKCARQVDLFPGYRIAKNQRHPTHVLICRSCGELNEVDDVESPGLCGDCGTELALAGTARRGTVQCPHCSTVTKYPQPDQAPSHRMIALEYFCANCKPHHSGRFFKRPDDQDLQRYDDATEKLKRMRLRYVPPDELRPGDETNRPLRWGYRRYEDMFNSRQLRGLEISARLIGRISDARVRRALITNFSDLLRYQNMLCRYDTMALKSLDIFSIHGFPVGLIQCESNLLGITGGNGGSVGSGGWTNIVAKYAKAKEYCESPFEFRITGKRTARVPVTGEWIGASRPGCRSRTVELGCRDSAAAGLAAESLDAVLTDPPYFGNVQYGELMEFCYVWLRRLADDDPATTAASVRHADELTGNVTMSRGLEHFTEGVSRTFGRMAHALKPNAPLAFTYHHNDVDAYVPIAVAILDSGLTCTACLACPAEMGGSIHISGTGSSIIDTVFVCRKDPQTTCRAASSALAIAEAVHTDLSRVAETPHNPTKGDVACVIHGYLTRAAIGKLQGSWDRTLEVPERMERVRAVFRQIACVSEVEQEVMRLGPFQVADAGEPRLFDDLVEGAQKGAASV